MSHPKQSKIYQRKWDLWNTDPLIPARKPELIKKKKRTRHLVDFAIPVEHRVKIKESETIKKYLDLARELKKLWNMKMTLILIGMIFKGLEKRLVELEIRRRIETIQTTAQLKSTWIF